MTLFAQGVTRAIIGFGRKHGVKICSGLAIASFAKAIEQGIRVTPKAVELINEAKYRKEKAGLSPELTSTEMIKTTARCYIPCIVFALLGSGFVIGANFIANAQYMGALLLYEGANKALKMNEQAMINEFGDKANMIIHEARQQIANDIPAPKPIMVSESDKIECLDWFSKRKFWSNRKEITACIQKVNTMIQADRLPSINDYYYEMCAITGDDNLDLLPIGEDYGWNSHMGIIDPDLVIDSGFNKVGDPIFIVKLDPKLNYSL